MKIADIQAAIFEQTGIKTSVSKNKGSMKHHITIRPLFQNGAYPYFNINWAQEFGKQFQPVGTTYPYCNTSQLDLPTALFEDTTPIKYKKERKPIPLEQRNVRQWGSENSQMRLDKKAASYAKKLRQGKDVPRY